MSEQIKQETITMNFPRGSVWTRQGGGYMLKIDTNNMGYAEPWALDDLKKMATAIIDFINVIEPEKPIEADM
jgi:hypothetical protein